MTRIHCFFSTISTTKGEHAGYVWCAIDTFTLEVLMLDFAATQKAAAKAAADYAFRHECNYKAARELVTKLLDEVKS